MGNPVSATGLSLSSAAIRAPAGLDLAVPPRQELTPPAILPHHRGLVASAGPAKNDLIGKLRGELTQTAKGGTET